MAFHEDVEYIEQMRPDMVQIAADDFLRVGRLVRSGLPTLDRLRGTVDWRGDARDRYEQRLREATDLLDELQSGYDKTGTALAAGEGGVVMRRAGLAALVALLLAVVVGCTRDASRETVPSASSELFDKIVQLQRGKTSAPLKSLTDFEWDGVRCYYEGASTDQINDEAGGAVERPGGHLAVSGALAVFVKDGKPVRKARIPEINFKMQRYSAAVLVRDGFELTEPPAG